MNASRRLAATLAAGLLSLLMSALESTCPAQDKVAEDAADPFSLVHDKSAGPKLAAAADYAREGDWKTAVRLLQHLLDGKEDTLVRIAGPHGRPDRYGSARAEAERILSTLPAAGRAYYQQTYGPPAAEWLIQARAEKDAERYRRIVQRYLYTEAGPTALRELAQHSYRTGRLQQGALCYARLMEHLGLARWQNEELYQAAMAFQQQGTAKHADAILKQLRERARQNVIDLGSRKLTLEELRKEIERAVTPRQSVDWPVYRGNAERSTQAVGGLPFLVPSWRKSMLYDEKNDNSVTYRRLRQAEKWLLAQKQPVIPPFAPITVTVTRGEEKMPLLIYRNYWGIVARSLKKVRQGNTVYQEGAIAWESPSTWSLEHIFKPSGDLRKQVALSDWLNDYVGENAFRRPRFIVGDKSYPIRRPQILFENSTVGTLSTDGQYVYAIEDLAVPPPLLPRVDRQAVKKTPRQKKKKQIVSEHSWRSGLPVRSRQEWLPSASVIRATTARMLRTPSVTIDFWRTAWRPTAS